MSQIYDPNAKWQDVPSALRTPGQNAQMIFDVIYFGLPLLLIAIGVAMLVGASERKSEGERFFMRLGAFAFMIGGAISMYFIWFH